MNKISNANKQARFRKKEQLKRHANNIFKKWQSWPPRWNSKKAQDVLYALDKIVDLPHGWTDEDYEHAAKNLSQYYAELFYHSDYVANDVTDGMNFRTEFIITPDPDKLMRENKAAIENARELSAHIISALKISNSSDAVQAAALMEAIRFVGISLVNSREVPRSKATTMCLATIGPQYERPEWFAKKLANTVAWQVGKETAQEIGRYLSEFEFDMDKHD